MINNILKQKEKKIFVIIYSILVFTSVVLMCILKQYALERIIEWSVTFHGDYPMAVEYATNGYDLSVTHAYPPLLNLFYLILGKIVNSSSKLVKMLLAIIYNFVPVVITYRIINKNFTNLNKIMCIMLSLPGAFFTCFRSCNVAYMFNIFSLYYIINYKNQNILKRELSIFCLSIAICLRLSPAVFGFLLLIDKRYKDIMKLFIYCCLLFFLPALFIAPNISYFKRILLFINQLIQYNNLWAFNHIGVFRFLQVIIDKITGYNIYDVSYTFPLKICSIVFSIVSLAICVFIKDYYKKILLLCFVFFVNSSVTYHSYVIFLIPLLYYFNDDNAKINIIILILYILSVFLPVAIFHVEHTEFLVSLHSIIIDGIITMLMIYFYFDFIINRIFKHKIKE